MTAVDHSNHHERPLGKGRTRRAALGLPIGLVRDPSGIVIKDPDLAVQERIGLVFETFLKVRTVAKVMRVLNDRGLAAIRHQHVNF